MPGGKRTMHGGRLLEEAVEALTLVGFQEGTLFPRKFRKNHPYTTLFGTPGRMEYFLESDEFTGRLECKYQDQGGSVDEKLALIMWSLKDLDSHPGLILLTGGQYWQKSRPQAALRWCRKVAIESGKPCYILEWKDFFRFVRNIWG